MNNNRKIIDLLNARVVYIVTHFVETPDTAYVPEPPDYALVCRSVDSLPANLEEYLLVTDREHDVVLIAPETQTPEVLKSILDDYSDIY